MWENDLELNTLKKYIIHNYDVCSSDVSCMITNVYTYMEEYLGGVLKQRKSASRRHETLQRTLHVIKEQLREPRKRKILPEDLARVNSAWLYFRSIKKKKVQNGNGK